jgi:hypothetical protein
MSAAGDRSRTALNSKSQDLLASGARQVSIRLNNNEITQANQKVAFSLPMKWVIRIVAALFFYFVFFGAIQHYLPHLDTWISVVLAIAGAAFTALLATFDFVKKLYDARKAPYELRKLKREEDAEKAKNSVIKTPDIDQLKKHGQSAVERALDERFKTTGRDSLKPGRFIVDSREEKP